MRGRSSAKALASYNRATLRTAAVLADPKASLMDRYRAAAAEEAARPSRSRTRT